MNVTDERVWETVCPTKCVLEKYHAQLIPFEILELIAMVKTKGYFDIDKINDKSVYQECPHRTIGWIEIWDRPKEQIDPLVVGVIKSGHSKEKDKGYWYNDKKSHYLLARWGHELIPFAEIVTQAKKLWTEKRTADARRRTLDEKSPTPREIPSNPKRRSKASKPTPSTTLPGSSCQPSTDRQGTARRRPPNASTRDHPCDPILESAADRVLSVPLAAA